MKSAVQISRAFRPSAGVASGRGSRRGAALIEICLGLGALLILAMLQLRSSVLAAQGQHWTVVQTMSDAYLTREVAFARQVPYEAIDTPESDWPTYPRTAREEVTIGKLPGRKPVKAWLVRTKRAEADAFDDVDPEPDTPRSWKLESFLTYEISGRQYVKSRTFPRGP
ncbi:MAG: hypothetical protein KDM91_05575 [Verrucomicrobiae bacterium]|nr:hypothetical protein [Verrucomicrobiae bacterium]MCP5540517.1 hypothetical protein [Akkermansiaceae bacterium]MCP5550781.1 hypothetical protein [Akkermansiaceae bacterium]